MNYVALDTETTLIADRQGIWKVKGNYHTGTVGRAERKLRACYTSPYETPELVLGSWCTGDEQGVLMRDDFLACVAVWLARDDAHLVMHHAPFDVDVILRAAPDLREPMLQALAAGRIHDTKVMDVLDRLFRGYFDTPRPPKWELPQVQPRSLAELAEEHAGMVLNKDDALRLNFGQFLGKSSIPAEFEKYAVEDAIATYKVWHSLLLGCTSPTLWGEPAQTRADVLMQALDTWGVCVDREEAKRLHGLFSADIGPLQDGLVAAGLAAWEPVPGTTSKERISRCDPIDWAPLSLADPEWIVRIKTFQKHSVREVARRRFHLYQNAVRERLNTTVVPGMSEPPKTTDTGLLSLDPEYWADFVEDDGAGLITWKEHEKLKKILNTYLELYSRVDIVYPKVWPLKAKSGRMAYSNPNLQNVPKQKHGLRSLFVPHPGHYFVVADYNAQEVYTLCEVMHTMGLVGPLFEVLSSSEDIHYQNAARLLGKAVADVTKPERQLAKVLIFGVGGGLGPKKLAMLAHTVYNVDMTIEEARARKRQFLRVFWDIDAYLRRLQTDLDTDLKRTTGNGLDYWRRFLGVDAPGVMAVKEAFRKHEDVAVRQILWEAERSLCVTLPTSGRVRKGCLFTEGANTYFQGSAADVTKLAVANCLADGIRVVLVVHDEIVAEFPEGYPPEDAKRLVESHMLNAFRALCPKVGPYARVEAEAPLSRWGKATDKEGHTI